MGSQSTTSARTPALDLRDQIAQQLCWAFTGGLCPLDGPCTECDCYDPHHEVMRAEADKIISIIGGWLEKWIESASAVPVESSNAKSSDGGEPAQEQQTTPSSRPPRQGGRRLRRYGSGLKYAPRILRSWTNWKSSGVR